MPTFDLSIKRKKMNYKIPGMLAFICAPFLYNDFSVSAQNCVSSGTNLFTVAFIAVFICSYMALKHIEVRGRTKPGHIAPGDAGLTAIKINAWKKYIPVLISFCLPPNVAPAVTSGINFIASSYSPIVTKVWGKNYASITREFKS